MGFISQCIKCRIRGVDRGFGTEPVAQTYQPTYAGLFRVVMVGRPAFEYACKVRQICIIALIASRWFVKKTWVNAASVSPRPWTDHGVYAFVCCSCRRSAAIDEARGRAF